MLSFNKFFFPALPEPSQVLDMRVAADRYEKFQIFTTLELCTIPAAVQGLFLSTFPDLYR